MLDVPVVLAMNISFAVAGVTQRPTVDTPIGNGKCMVTAASTSPFFKIAKTSLAYAAEALEKQADWSNEALFETLKALAAEKGLKNGQILYPVRIALSGKETTPGGATELAVVLGKEETLNRIRTALSKLN